ncbi:MAG TPA: metal ABC transporter permease [Acidimicrobiales bacterium]|nr:metal ABC transporter permease [Acidimicrobiales bacterium]
MKSLGLASLVLAGVVAGEATQIVGELLLLGLLTSPSAGANRLFADPMRAMRWSVLFTVVAVWSGLTISYLWSSVPPSFSIIAVATGIRIAATLGGHRSAHHRERSVVAPAEGRQRAPRYPSTTGSRESTTDDVDIAGFD